MGPIKTVNSPAEFDVLLRGSQNPPSLLVVDFWATWCGPCRAIAPSVEHLARQYPHAVFAKVDVDAQQQIAAKYQVTAMPTFKFFKNGREVDSLQGASVGALEAKIELHYVVVHATAASRGSSSSASGYPDITSNIDIKNMECLNQQDTHHVQNVIDSGSAYLESDVDEQLSIFLNFLQPCKIFAMSLKCSSEGHRPKTLRLFINRSNAIDFDEAESTETTQELELSESSYDSEGVALVNLRFVKFQRVFVVDNLGGEDTTRIENLRLYGETMDVTRMSNFKKEEGE